MVSPCWFYFCPSMVISLVTGHKERTATMAGFLPKRPSTMGFRLGCCFQMPGLQLPGTVEPTNPLFIMAFQKPKKTFQEGLVRPKNLKYYVIINHKITRKVSKTNFFHPPLLPKSAGAVAKRRPTVFPWGRDAHKRAIDARRRPP